MYGLIGKKISHSYSADFFNSKFQKEGIAEFYSLLPIPDATEIFQLIEENPNLKGLNVTIPYKQDVIPLLDEISEEAEKIGAVNVIKISRDNNKIFLKGYNTDCIGFKNSLSPLLNENIKSALILGTGGASKAVAFTLSQLKIPYKFVSRFPSEGQLAYKDLDDRMIKENLLIINTTPLGMFPDVESCPSIPYHYLTANHLCYDLVYNPQETKFMKEASRQGATVKNGYEMWLLQALATWDIWTK